MELGRRHRVLEEEELDPVVFAAPGHLRQMQVILMCDQRRPFPIQRIDRLRRSELDRQ